MLLAFKIIDDKLVNTHVIGLAGDALPPRDVLLTTQVEFCRRGEADLVAFVDEAWASFVSAEATKPTVRPKDDPERREQLIVSIVSEQGQVLYFHDIGRNPNSLGKGHRVTGGITGALVRED
jgi:hypothetical protein